MDEEVKRRQERLRRQKIRERQVKRMRLRLAGMGILLLAVIAAILSLSIHRKRVKAEEAAAKAKEEQMEKKREEQLVLEEENTLRIVAVGDNIMHDQILEEARQGDNSWDFNFLYTHMKDEIQKADLAAVNQETIFIGDEDEVGGYPDFGSPFAVGDALVSTGFRVVEHASNHAYDRGKQGILDTAGFWKKNYPQVSVLGIHDEEGDSSIRVAEVKNFKVAMLNYTYGVNGDTLSKDTCLLDILEREKVAAKVKEAGEMGDLVVFFLHAGTEYSDEPDESVQEWVKFLGEQGVDIIIGTHPHVLQGYEMRKEGDGHEMLVYYSLGNFASLQKDIKGLLGGMACITVKKDPASGKVWIEDYGLTPLVMHYDEPRKAMGVYKLEDYTEELAKEHGIHGETDDEFTVKSLKKMAGVQ